MKKLIVFSLIFILIVGVTGCQSNEPNVADDELPKAEDESQEITVNNISFERVKYEDLSSEVQAEIDEAKMEQGYKLIEDESSDYYYLAVFSGEKPSAGYGIEITKVIDNEGVTDVMVQEYSPAKGTMVAEILTYPMDIVKLTGITDNINIVYLTPKNTTEGEGSEEGENQLEDPNTPVENAPDSSSTLLETQFVVAEYVGQIDNNSIEVKIEDGPQAFRLNGIAKDDLSKLELEEGDLVKLEVFKDENGHPTVYSMEKPKK